MKLTVRIALLCLVAVVGLSVAITKTLASQSLPCLAFTRISPSVRTLAISKECES
jgi:hypothetical protein